MQIKMWRVQCAQCNVHSAMCTGVRMGECPVIPPVHWKGVALPRQRSLRTLKTLSNCKGLYSLFSAVERFPYLQDFKQS